MDILVRDLNAMGKVLSSELSCKQRCHGQGKILEKRNFFQVREKSGNSVDGRENLERTWKVREKSGNLEINGYGRQTS